MLLIHAQTYQSEITIFPLDMNFLRFCRVDIDTLRVAYALSSCLRAQIWTQYFFISFSITL
jgi:hypothetical protein